MPLNEYHCPKCDTSHDIIHSHDWTPECPNCGCTELDKQFPKPSHRWGKGVKVDNPKRMWHGLPEKAH